MNKGLKISALILAGCIVAAGAFLALRPNGLLAQKREKEAAVKEEIESLEALEDSDAAIFIEETGMEEEESAAAEETSEIEESSELIESETSEEVLESEGSAEESEESSEPEEPVETEAEKQARLEREAAERTQGFETIFDDIMSEAAVLIRYRDDYLGGIVAELNPEEELDPASTTKLMTSLVAAEALIGTDAEVEIPGDVFDELNYWNASMSGFLPGEIVTPEDCIHSMLMHSGCDACVAIARAVCGSEEEFVERMNAKAQELGMTHTHYSNVHGLGAYEHYTSVRDLAILLKACYENEFIFSVLKCTGTYQTQPTNMHEDGKLLDNITEDWFYDYPDDPVRVLGCKTGYVSAVGQNLASIVEADGEIYLLVTMGAPGDPYKGQLYHYLDQSNILDDLAYRINENMIVKEISEN